MQQNQISMLESLRIIQAFVNQHKDKLDPDAQKALVRLATTVKTLDDYAATQVGGVILAKDLTQKQEAQRAALIRDHMGAIAAIAKTDLPRVPEVADLRLPRVRLTGQRLAAAAVRMGNAAKLHASVFVASGMPENFVEQLQEAADALMETVNERATTRTLAGGAADALRKQIAEARNVVGILDRFATKALRDEPDLLKQWKLIKRVPRGPRTPPSDSTTPTTPPTPTPPPASPVSPGIAAA